MPTIFDQPNTDYANSGTISDGATIAATGVRLTNMDSGRIYVGVTFAAAGGTLINELGGVIRVSQFDQSFGTLLVSGSSGADTVINAGLIGGLVSLGAGDDSFVDRDGTVHGVDLGADNDTFRVEGTQPHSLSAAGGAGVDRVVLAGTGNQYWGSSLTGFEQLVLETGGNLENFSGYQSITLSPAPTGQWTFFNFISCYNPLVDLALAGQSIIVQNSSFHSITGSDGSDTVELGFGAVVSGGISLGGGDDGFSIESNQSAGVPPVSVAVDGGSGNDTLTLNWFTAGDRSYDLSSIQGFEKLNVNAWYIADHATARVAHVSGLTDIEIGRNVTLILSDSDVANARVGGGFGGGLTLEAGVVIDRYGFPEDGPWDQRLDIAQGDPALSTAITNHGSITGAVRFYTGDDLYDGRDGTIGGTIYGNAGNDTLLGGAGAETMVGGYGADILEGNGGADNLTGGAGADIFRGTAASLSGDTITDYSAGDRIVVSDASLAGFSVALNGSTLTFTGGALTLADFAGQLIASAAPGGGVQIMLLKGVGDARNDFNGDGFSDLLFRHSSGLVTDWLGIASGGFVGNFGNFGATVDASWQIAGTGDFNGDGRDDVLWRHSSGLVTDWLGRGNGGFTDNFANAATYSVASHQVAGTGDFNGDGKDDIVWRFDGGAVATWLGEDDGGFDIFRYVSANVDVSWKIVGTGDFNGDGRDDILWRHSSGLVSEWLGTLNGGFSDNFANASASVATSWHIAGIGDFNGDGKDDILWRHDSGFITNWLAEADGGFTPNNGNAWSSADASWQVEATGDYNGDGRDDILWRHDSGLVTDWLGTASGGFAVNNANALTAVSNDWAVQSIDLHLV